MDLNFLSDRPQVVRVGERTSGQITLNTGAPQGCVLSPLLYTLFTYDCVSAFDDCLVVKFADDTTVAGLIHGSDETNYRTQTQNLVAWGSDNNLELNVPKTKEMIINFRWGVTEEITPLTIIGSEVEIVTTFKFLGIHLSSDLGWEVNAGHCLKKAQQRLFYLRPLKGFSLSKDVLTKFYRVVDESVLTLSIVVWYDNTTQEYRLKLERIVRSASKIIGTDLPSVESIYYSRLRKKSESIIEDDYHPARDLFKLLPSGKRYTSIRTNSARSLRSTYPKAVRNSK